MSIKLFLHPPAAEQLECRDLIGKGNPKSGSALRALELRCEEGEKESRFSWKDYLAAHGNI